MGIDTAEAAYLRIRIPSRQRTLRDAARLERAVLSVLRDVFDWHQHIVTGEPKRAVPIDIDDEAGFTETIVRLRRTHPRADFHDEQSTTYTADSVPFLYTTMNRFMNPSPRRSLSPDPDEATAWLARFWLGGSEERYEQVVIGVPLGTGFGSGEVAKLVELIERLVLLTDPEDARYACNAFDKAFWEVSHRIGWLTYFSQPSLVEHLRDHPRARPFHRGLILQLSDDPADMLDDAFVQSGFEFGQSLVPYWPPQLDN